MPQLWMKQGNISTDGKWELSSIVIDHGSDDKRFFPVTLENERFHQWRRSLPSPKPSQGQELHPWYNSLLHQSFHRQQQQQNPACLSHFRFTKQSTTTTRRDRGYGLSRNTNVFCPKLSHATLQRPPSFRNKGRSRFTDLSVIKVLRNSRILRGTTTRHLR